MSPLGKDVGGNSVHISDCFIWSEIYYLDSTTNYREYLPEPQIRPRPASHDELVLLDNSTITRNCHFLAPMAILVLLVVVGCLLWYVLNNF
jgi:hypothetical protein